MYGFVENNGVNDIDYLGLEHKKGGAVGNLDQIPEIMDNLGFSMAAKTMKRWFSRNITDTSAVADILTIKWAEGFDRFNIAVNDIKARATNEAAGKSLVKTLKDNGLLKKGVSAMKRDTKTREERRSYAIDLLNRVFRQNPTEIAKFFPKLKKRCKNDKMFAICSIRINSWWVLRD